MQSSRLCKTRQSTQNHLSHLHPCGAEGKLPEPTFRTTHPVHLNGQNSMKEAKYLGCADFLPRGFWKFCLEVLEIAGHHLNPFEVIET